VKPCSDSHYMAMAYEEAVRAAAMGEVPVGAVVVDGDGRVVARAGNRSITDNDPSGHAEMAAIRAAGAALKNYRLTGCTLFVTLEPCVMCAGAMVHARLRRVVYGAADPKSGALASCYRIGGDGLLNHALQATGGVLEKECAAILRDFFRARRKSRENSPPLVDIKDNTR